jgi:hypothetical protein
MKRIIEINLILGIWLIAAPFVLAYATGHIPAVSNDVAIGVLLVACSLWILAATVTPLPAVVFQGLCGAWLIAAPFALHERTLTHALANNVVVGAIVLLASLTEAWMATRRVHHTA